MSSTLNPTRGASQARASSMNALEATSEMRKVGRSYSIHSATTSRQPSVPVPVDPTFLRPVREAHNPAASYHCIGLMMPVYLAPLIYHGSRESLCLFSVLLPLCWWLTASIPRCVAAFAPVLTLPVLQLMSPDETAAYFFESDSLEVVAFLALVTAGHTSSGSLLRRLSYQFCSKYGLQVQALYLSLSCTAYVLAIFVHKSLLAVLFVLAVEKVLSCVHESELDKGLIEEHALQEPAANLPLRRSKSLVPTATNRPDADKLFARLAQAVDYLSDDTAEAVTLKKRKTRVADEVQPQQELQQPKQETWELDPAGATSPGNAFASPVKGPRKRSSKGTEALNVSSGRRASVTALSRRTSVVFTSTMDKPDEDAAYSTRTRKRFVDKLMRRSGAPTPGKAIAEASIISALGGKRSSQQDQAAVPLDASVADVSRVSRRKERTALLDSLPVRDSSLRRKNVQKLRRGSEGGMATVKTNGAGASAAVALGASTVAPPAPPASKNGAKAPSDSIVERDENAHAVTVKAEADTQVAPLAAVNSVLKSPKERGTLSPNTQSTSAHKGPGECKETAVAPKSPAKEPHALSSREGANSKRKTTRSGSHRRKKRSQERVALAAAPSDGGAAAPLSEAPVTACSDVEAPAGAEPPNERNRPVAASKIDIRRPSILKFPRPSRSAFHVPADVRGRQSTVDFGLAPSGLVEGNPGKVNLSPDGAALSGETPSKAVCQFAVGVADGASSEAGSGKQVSPITPAARRRRLSLAPRRFSSISYVATSPSAPFASASMNETTLPGSDPMAQRKRAHNSLRTACLLTCSLVTVSASASSMITGAAKDALANNFIVKKGLQGLVAWLVLVTPASILCAVSCCAMLYFIHLRGRKGQTAGEMNEVCVTAATRLRKMGPIKSNDLLIAYGLVVYIGFVALGVVFGYNASKNMLSFLSFLLVASSALPVTIERFWEEDKRMLVWASVSRDMPWAVVIINSTVQLATRIVESNNLVESGLDSLGIDFWTQNSPLANQILLGAIGSVLAEVTDNKVLNVDLMPFVVKVAKVTAVEPWVYVVPAALGACTNMILPIHLPMIVIHEVVDVPMLQLVLIAAIAKTVIVLTSVFSVNTYGGYLLDWAAPQFNTTEAFE